MTARLRPMRPADLPAVAALERGLFPEDAWSMAMFASEISGLAAGRYYLVAEQEGEVVGYAGLLAPAPGRRRRRRPDPGGPEPGGPAPGGPEPGGSAPGGQADVLTMAVATSHWGRGIGSALLTELLAEAGRRACTEVFLEVRADNPRAKQLYRRHGFTEAGLRRGYYQPSGVDAIVMCRPAGPGQPVPAAGHAPGESR